MQIGKKIIKGKPENQSEKDQASLEGLWVLRRDFDNLIKDLESKTSYLPRVDEEGNSKCDFAEKLYAQKEEAEEKLIHTISAVESYLPALDREESRCRHNLNRIRSDNQRLNLPESKKSYSEAERAQKAQLHKLVEDRKSVTNALKRAHFALEIAADKKFPGRKPQRKSPSVAPMSTTQLPGRPGNFSPPTKWPAKQPPSLTPLGGTAGLPGNLGGGIGGILSTGPLK